MIRPGRDADAAGFIALIGDCWAEYPNCVLDVDGEVPELRALATYFAGQGGMLWAAEHDGKVVGMVGTRPMHSDRAWEICRMYVAADQRGSGLAARLLETAEAEARAQGAARLVLWTDTRFDRAHGFYEKRGYVRQGAIRILDDLSKSLEFRYAKPAIGLVVEALDAAAAASAERRLAEILAACVAAGPGLSFRHPLPPDRARAAWRRAAADVAAGRRLLLAAWLEGALVGTVQLLLDMPENQAHRAEVAMLLVDPATRRQGIGRALLQRVEQAAQRLGRRLLVLDSLADGAADRLCHASGWTAAGAVPGFALDAEGAEHAAIRFWKRV
ncbi:GNAT family N-acetyltransferase [Paracraurococcus ruber]|uniref:GNAT family N-acetyltransferase n=1 Tax=Paracraurococcus ruber TaxID=77675 RepID=A0ABS1CRG4_9PROT|nr:GNAT family N-acetyltransferase [Paracraurococcus ruber]MBK1656953.1 GNAT family N-acetyltransferase [Paracraurococcus ruber]TDG34252.1 GNAT family N-acetyltransferase [Paracraurococcus ruber]